MKCTQCSTKLEETFLNKLKGTPKREGKKITWMCSACQRMQDTQKKNSK